ncbi:hypothetical protein ACIGNX_10270 [Actinosynnema sp. NPDC053489]|uniref:hypothetical protein n=1 Tax=Actinosynnema sp. NPDC053489 TaxID=3363916 RepID=UPI0037CAC854
MHRTRSALPLAAAALGVLALPAVPAHAGTDVPCDAGSLVAAVTAANASPEPDTLSLTAGCVYTLTGPAVPAGEEGLPRISGELTVLGNGATIRRAPDAPQFRLIANWGTLTLSRVTLTGGHAPDGVGVDSSGQDSSGQDSSGQGNAGGSGGAIQNWGPLTIADSVLTGNRSGAGAPGADATATTPAGVGGLGGFGGAISSYVTGPGAGVTITTTLITDNRTGPGGRGGDGVGRERGGRGGSGGFGAGVEVLRGSVLRVTGSTVTGNVTGDGAPGGAGGPEGGGGGDGGGGGVGAGLFVSTDQGRPLFPVIATTLVNGNRTGRGGDSGVPGPGGYAGWAGAGGRGGGVGIFYERLTFDGSEVTGNTAGGPGTGTSPLRASGGGVATLEGSAVLAGSHVTGNLPDNCTSVEDVRGCVNARRVPPAGSAAVASPAPVRSVPDRSTEDLAAAVRAASAVAPR